MDATGANRERQNSERWILLAIVVVGGMVLGWFAINFKLVWDRRSLWQELNASGVVLQGGISGPFELFQAADNSFELSTTRKLCGDETHYGLLYFPHRPATAADIAAAAHFPEVHAFIDGPGVLSE